MREREKAVGINWERVRGQRGGGANCICSTEIQTSCDISLICSLGSMLMANEVDTQENKWDLFLLQ